MQIRPAETDDVHAVQRVARDSWHAVYDSALGAETVDETVDSWYDPDRLVTDDVEPGDRPFFVAVDDGTVVGFAEAVPDDTDDRVAHLYRIYVDPDHWGQGVGGSLLDRVETVLEARGFERLRLSVLAENDVGIGFYEANGFDRVSTTHDDDLGVDEHEYAKDL